jgi:predicted  nucleic acid-binding Zn-ribbon protein
VAEPSRKRGADFETEICHLHKRLRATIPTAEEAISFLLPHITRLRSVYLESMNENAALKEHLETLGGAYYKAKGEKRELLKHVSRCQQEINGLRRQLDLAKYRLAMTDTTCKAAMFQ